MIVTTSLEVNVQRRWMDKLGWWLRRLAERMDGRITLAIRYESDPEVPAEDVRKALELGMAHADGLLRHAVRDEAFSYLMDLHESQGPVDGEQGPCG